MRRCQAKAAGPDGFALQLLMYSSTGNSDNPHTIESRFTSLELFQANCNKTFPQGLPPSPNVDEPNKYGGWHINPSNIMFSSGEYGEFQTRAQVLSLKVLRVSN